MSAFFRFPHTPHLAWLGTVPPRGDKVLTPSERAEFLSRPLIVEEKVDGANVGFSVSADGELRVQNRGTYLDRDAVAPQFRTLFQWAESRRGALVRHLRELILFGEWCYAVHTVHYTVLPDWFVAFDVYDVTRRVFWSVARRDAFIEKLDLRSVPRLREGRCTMESLKRILGTSALGAARGEGLYLRPAEPGGAVERAKLVTPEFVQAIGEHWSKRALQTNELVAGASRW